MGAGVSGCACALAAAEAGVSVLLLNSSLDSVGSPSYGPALWAGHAAHLSPATEPISAVGALVSAAPGVADAWSKHSRLPVDGRPFLLVDRRSVSLETKWRLENEPLVQIRQAIVTAVTTQSEGTILIRSVFGEEWEADVVVLAVGLALGGRISLGTQKSSGGRYGEVAADLLLENLTVQGVTFVEKEMAVGARLGRRAGALDLAMLCSNGAVVALRSFESEAAALPHEDCLPSSDLGILPPSPYEESLRSAPDAVLVGGTESDDRHEPTNLWLAPDGIATGEWYLDPEVDVATARAIASADGWWSAEPQHSVRGNIAAGDGSPQEVLNGVWVVGQVAGADGYVGSLESGWQLGRHLGSLREPPTDAVTVTAVPSDCEELRTHHADEESCPECLP